MDKYILTKVKSPLKQPLREEKQLLLETKPL